MRALVALGVVLAAAVAVFVVSSGGADAPSPDGIADVAPAANSQPAGAPGERDASASAATATALEPQRVPVDLATEITAVLSVIDTTSGMPVEGAAVYRMRGAENESAIAYSDARGIAPLPLSKPSQLMVAKAGYLLRMAPTQLGSTAESPQQARLVRDTISARGKFRFRRPDGSSPDDVCVVVRPTRADKQDQPMPEKARVADEETQRAWREQRTLAAVRAVPELHVQLGFHNAAFVHVLRADDEIAFVEGGAFAIEAATPDGFCKSFVVDTANFGNGAIDVVLQQGAQLRGAVRFQGGGPAEGAWIEIDGGDPLRLVARSGADGTFVIGPLADGERRLRIRHRDSEAATFGPFAPTSFAEIALVALPRESIRGRIVAAGDGKPIRGASASLLEQDGNPLVVPADDEGYFAAVVRGADAIRMNAGAEGFLTHSELVSPGTPSFAVELWPASQERRLELGLTSLLSGVVVDANNAPMPRIGVRFVPDSPDIASPGRRLLAGGALSLPQAITTGADGSFVLEVATFGGGLVQAIDGTSSQANGVRVDAQRGKVATGLRVTATRR